MKLAIVAAAFSPEDANRLRRAMATFRNVGTMHNFQAKLVDGMVARGYQREFAERCYKQIEGFGSYGFPESHAQSFARLVYVSAWIKHHHPAAFAAALLNSQPMGFYAPAQIVRDAEEHGVTVLPPDVNISFWNNALEPWRDAHALRLGFRQIDGFREAWADALVAARADGPFDSMEALARRAALPRRALRLLAEADACGALGGRREALWEARRTPGDALPLFAQVGAAELGDEPDAALPTMALPESVVADYQALRLSLRAHPVAFLRERLAADGVVPCAKVQGGRDGAKVAAAGIVLVRQRPGKGNAIFMTLEDETGIANVVLWASDFERQRLAVMAARLMEVRGRIQRSPEGVVHLMATTVIDRSAELDLLSQTHRAEPQLSRADTLKHPQHPGNGSRAGRVGHPRDARLLPHSRDFH
jgi:error-prone DNA polymerase